MSSESDSINVDGGGSTLQSLKEKGRTAWNYVSGTLWTKNWFKIVFSILLVLFILLTVLFAVLHARERDHSLRMNGAESLAERLGKNMNALGLSLKSLVESDEVQHVSEESIPNTAGAAVNAAGAAVASANGNAGTPANSYQVRKDGFTTFSQASAFPGTKQAVGKELMCSSGSCGSPSSCNVGNPGPGYPGNFALQQRLTPMESYQTWNPESREGFENNYPRMDGGDAAYPENNNIYQSGSMGLTATTITGVYANAAGSPAASLGVSF